MWRNGHTLLAVIIVVSTIVHAILIEGTMETISKVVLCALVLVATMKVVAEFRFGRASSAKQRNN